MVSWLIYGVVSLLVHAVALKLAVGAVSDGRDNTYATALGLSAILMPVGAVLAWIPVLGWIAYILIWLTVVAGTYRIGVGSAVLVALAQTLIHCVLAAVLKLVGLSL